MTRGSLIGIKRTRDQKGLKRMKATSQISLSQSLMVTIPYMSSPLLSSTMACTAWAPLALASRSTGRSYLLPNASPLTRRGNSPIGSLTHSATTPPTWQWSTIHKPRKTGELQLSFTGIMTCTITLPAWLQSSRAWPLPLKPSSCSWSKDNNASLAPMPTRGINSFIPSTRALTSIPSPRGSLLLSPTAVQLDSKWRVMSQGSLPEGKRTTGGKE